MRTPMVRSSPGRCERLTAATRLVLLAGVFVALAVHPFAARASTPGIDRSVTAIPASVLLASSPQSLLDPRRQNAALRLRAFERPLFIGWVGPQLLALLWLWRSGGGARLRDAIRRRIAATFWMRFLYAAALTYLAALASLPALLVRYRVDVAFGTTLETPGAWLRDTVVNATVDAVVVGVIVASIFALVDRTRLWYAYATVGLFLVTLLMAFVEPITIAPLYNRFTPLPAHARIRVPLDALAARAGIRDAPIYIADLSRRSHSVTADIAGFGPTKRIVLGDALLADATPGEVLFVAAREFGHYAHGDDFRLSLLWTFLFIFATALAVVIADRVSFRRDDDALARLSLVFVFMGVIGLALVPVYNAYSRNIESRADAYALYLTHDRASAIRAYVRIADDTLVPLCPSRAARLYFSNSPPVGTRIAKAGGHRNPCP
jgi:STE24 endopeptidase